MRGTRTAAASLLVGLALALGACGESDEDQARDDVCDARADIKQQIESLQGLTLATATKDQVTTALNAIKEDLEQIGGATDELGDDLKQQVQQANQTFKADLDAAVEDVGQSTSLAAAAEGIKSAIAQLGTSYRQALEPIDCE